MKMKIKTTLHQVYRLLKLSSVVLVAPLLNDVLLKTLFS